VGVWIGDIYHWFKNNIIIKKGRFSLLYKVSVITLNITGLLVVKEKQAHSIWFGVVWLYDNVETSLQCTKSQQPKEA